MPTYFYYIAGVVGIIIFIWFWLKFSPARCLVISLVNSVYGILLLSSLRPDTAGLTIILVVSVILIIFGVWGFILWVKYTANRYKDHVADSEPIESWWNTIRAFDLILVIGLVLRLFIIQPFIVEGPSMDNNFRNGEIILVDKISYRLHPPIPGEVVIFKAPRSPQDDYIKRLIGMPGDKVSVKGNIVTVNGKIINQLFLSESAKVNSDLDLEVTVGPNEYFVLGDNRPHSSDSREWGDVPQKNIIGRAVVSLYPFDMFGLIKTPKL